MLVFVASEVFQRTIKEVLQGIDMTINKLDDIIVGGNHDKNLTQVIETIDENSLTVNLPKCEFNVP